MKTSPLQQTAEKLYSGEVWPEGKIRVDLRNGRVYEDRNGVEQDLTTVVRQIALFEDEADKRANGGIKELRFIIEAVMKAPGSENMPASKLREFLMNNMVQSKPRRPEELAGLNLTVRTLLMPHVVQRALEQAAESSGCLDLLKAVLAKTRNILKGV